jgi:pimeloyl-ACP methyl ester carboxylesterase
MEKIISFQHKEIFYRVIGTGKPVVLVHGFGEDGEIWHNQVKFLREKFKLIIPDLPGSGHSAMIDDMSMEGMAEVILAIMNAEDCISCPVIGHSMGGYITLALAEKHPESLSAFGLFHSSAFADSDEKKANRQKGITFIQQHGAGEFLKTVTPNLFAPDSKEKIPEVIKDLLEQGNNFTPQSLVSYYHAMMQRPDRTNVLRKAAVPVLFIMGKYDNAVPMEDSLKQCHLPEKSYIHILAQSGHMGMLEEADRCNLILEEFLLET